MTARRILPLLAVAVASACAPHPAPAPAPATPVHRDTVAAEAKPAPAADSLISYRVPAFRRLPIITWGPLPPGTEHAERARAYDLQHQDVHVRFDWARHAVVGTTTIRFAALDSALTTVRFDQVGMTIRAVRDASGRALRYTTDDSSVVVTLPRRLAPHAATSVTIDYEAVRPKKGAYFIDRRHVVWTQGETQDTRYWVPTYDYPNDKETWDFWIRTARSEKALSNGTLVGSRPVGDEVEWHWKLDHPASTYLMTAVTGDWVVLKDRWRDVPVDYWTYPDSVQAGWRGFGHTPRMVDVFSRATGLDFPWVKYDQVTAPDYIFGGMENVTATTQADDDILHPAWAEPQANADGLVAHELGHQWFGDYVTTADWGDIWLNEGFATFMEQTFREADRGADEAAIDRLEAQESTIEADMNARRPLVYDRWMTDPLELFFSGHIYPKGATVLQMMRHMVGDSLFWASMHRYLADHARGNVVSADLERAFEQTTGRSFARFFHEWVYGAGFPVFQVRFDYDPRTKRGAITANEVQARDSLTGWFDADVDCEILTDSGPVDFVVPVREGLGRMSVVLPAPPRSVRWNKGGWLLEVTDFPRATAMLAYDLAHDGDVLGRIDAIDQLASRHDEPMAARALAGAARGDAFWAVRARASAALGLFGGDSVAREALLVASRDSDSRVRQQAASSLRAFPGDAVVARLRELMTGDSSLYVRGAALGAYVTVDSAGALDAIRGFLAQDSWRDILRTQAVTALRLVDSPDAWTLLKQYLAPGTSRETRTAAIRALVSKARGREAELARALEPLLSDEDLFIRQSAAEALGVLGQPSSLPALEARRKVEAESRVINDIDAAIAEIRRRGR